MPEILHDNRSTARGRWGWARGSISLPWRRHLPLIGLELLLAAALLGLLGSGRIVVLPVPVEKGSLWWVQFPWFAAAALLSGLIALVTFLLTRAQNQEQFERQQAAEQERFDRGELDDLFIDIQNRFASESAIMRANAAIRLGEMAEMRLPGKPADRTRESYPFFSRAVSQLAAALHMETEQAVRDEVMKALYRMTGFAGDGALFPPLLLELACANRNAGKAFLEGLARYCSLFETVTDGDLRPLVGFAPFCLEPATTLAALRSLAASKRCRDAAGVYAALRAAERAGAASDPLQTPVPPPEERRLLLASIQSTAARLIDTRVALVRALRVRAAADHPTPPALLPGGEQCPLALLDLHEVHLQGADLRGASLQGVCLVDAHLQGAMLARARLQGAQLQGAELTDADLQEAELQEARFDRRTRWPAGFDPSSHGAQDVEEGATAASAPERRRARPASPRRRLRDRAADRDAAGAVGETGA